MSSNNLIIPKKDQLVAVQKFREKPAAFIGDEMGVGKTVTAIARDFRLREDYTLAPAPTLIVCEKIGLDVWLYHLKAMGVPRGEILVIDPKNRAPFEKALKTLREDLFHKAPPDYTYFILHYDVIRLLPDLTATPHPITWFHIIADEFHYIKNPKSQRTKLFKRLKTRFKTGCTGTPADDKPTDMWSLLNWLYPRQFSSYWRWYHKHVEYEEKERHEWVTTPGGGKKMIGTTGYHEVTGVKNVEQLHREIEPFYIRRMLLEVEPDMPELIYVEPPIMVDMTAQQRRAYDQMKKKSIARIESMDGGQEVLIAGAVVAVITRLQQMSLATLKKVIDPEYGEDEDEAPVIVLDKPSPKLDAVMNMLINHEDEPFVVFTQFRGMADLIEAECKAKEISVVKIHGGVTSHRGELVERFQSGKARVFVGTIAAAGKTITLTRAHHVIFTDLSWNPHRNGQAVARLWRRTQRNAVRVYRIETRNSIDQIRLEKIQTKAELVEALNNPGEINA
jgi:SNF2 family DNA or RNA helicase